jgi:hypothetical protein
VFFYSDLNYPFISELSKKELILSNEEFGELKAKKEFEYIIKNISNIDNLDIKVDNILPKLKVKVEISNDYSFVKIESILNYEEFELTPNNSQSEIIFN